MSSMGSDPSQFYSLIYIPTATVGTADLRKTVGMERVRLPGIFFFSFRIQREALREQILFVISLLEFLVFWIIQFQCQLITFISWNPK